MDESEWDERVGRDDGEGAQIRVREVDGRRSVVMTPKSIQRLDEEAHLEVEGLQACVFEIQAARDRMGEHVQVLRAKGVSWDSIGWCVGTTGRAAQMRWGDEDA